MESVACCEDLYLQRLVVVRDCKPIVDDITEGTEELMVQLLERLFNVDPILIVVVLLLKVVHLTVMHTTLPNFLSRLIEVAICSLLLHMTLFVSL